MTFPTLATPSSSAPRRLRKRKFGSVLSAIALAAITLTGPSAPAQAMEVTWLGASGNWDEAAQWSSGFSPSFSDIAFIDRSPDIGAFVRLFAPDVVTQIQGLRIGVGNVLELSSHLILSGGGWGDQVALINNGAIRVSGGTLSIGSGSSDNSQGALIFSAGGSLNLQSWRPTSFNGGSLISEGQVTRLNSNGNTVLRDLSLQGSFSVAADSRIALAGQIINHGELIFTADPVYRAGQLVLAGDTTLSGSGKTILSGVEGMSSGSLLTPGGGHTLTIEKGHTLEARGSITLGAGDLSFVNRGTIFLSSISSGQRPELALDPGVSGIHNEGGVIDLNSSGTGYPFGGKLELRSGELRGGTLKALQGSQLSTAVGAVIRDVRIDGVAGAMRDGSSLNLAGKITLGSGRNEWNGDDASLQVHDHETISLADDTEFANDFAAGGRGRVMLSGWMNHRGLVKGNGHQLLISGELWSHGGQLGQNDISVHNTGRISVGHELRIQAGPEEGLVNDGEIILSRGETNAIDGTMRPYWSKLDLQGTLMMGQDSVLGVSVSPDATGLQSGLLTVTGDVTLDGDVAFTVDRAPSGSEVTFLTFSGVRFGQFSSANAYASDWTTGIRYNVALIYGDHSVSAKFTSAVPEPQSWALMLGGIGLLGWMRKQSHSSRKELA